MRHLYVFDFDGTISRTKFPRPHTPVNLADALKVMDPRRVSLDLPRWSVIRWMRHIKLYAGRDTDIFILTGRPEAARSLTEAWLQVHGVPYDVMTMVGEPTCAPTHEKKRALLSEWKTSYSSTLMIDDDPGVGTVCAELGIGFVNATDM